MPPLEIPGHYYDPEKQRYFRIESSRTAPAWAAWSERNVKRQRRQAEEAEKAKRRKQAWERTRGIKRSVLCVKTTTTNLFRRPSIAPAFAGSLPALNSSPVVVSGSLVAGLLARETGIARCRPVGGLVGEHGSACGEGEVGDILLRSWVGGFKQKGSVQFLGDATISSMWVDSGSSFIKEVPGGMPAVFAIRMGHRLAESWIPTNEEEMIDILITEKFPGLNPVPTYHIGGFYLPLGPMDFHKPSGKLLMACSHRWLASFAPSALHTNLQNTGIPPQWHIPPPYDGVYITALRAAPPNSRLTGIMGTSRGLISFQDDELEWINIPSSPQLSVQQNSPNGRGRLRMNNPPWEREILSVDFLPSNPSEVLLAGTRSGHICLLDLRRPLIQPKTIRHSSAVAHIRAVGGHTILAAGPNHSMALYDLRFSKLSASQNHQPQASYTSGGAKGKNSVVKAFQNWNSTLPVVTFPGYRNEGHIHIGLDVLDADGYGSHGAVAAAHDDGTVGVYSLRDGTRLDSPEGVDTIRAPDAVRCLQWQTLVGEKHPSLFVGEGPKVVKYSFWA